MVEEKEKSKGLISQNVWLKRLGLALLVCAMYPSIVTDYRTEFDWTISIILGLVILTFAIKTIKGFFRSIFSS